MAELVADQLGIRLLGGPGAGVGEHHLPRPGARVDAALALNAQLLAVVRSLGAGNELHQRAAVATVFRGRSLEEEPAGEQGSVQMNLLAPAR